VRRLLPFFLLCLTACEREPDFSVYRDGIQHRLSTAAQVDFANEKTRTLWSADGRRMTLYCAEVKAQNGFGDTTGTYYAQVVVSEKNIPDYLASRPGAIFMGREMNIDYYLDCVRPDTQRPNDTLGKAYLPASTPFDPREGDAIQPVISDQLAPEFR
jgi:hypothetical protein